MANRYWVGGTAQWDATAGSKWALTSGGAGGQGVPTSSDDVFFDAGSGAVTVSVNGTVNCNNLNFSGFTGTFTYAAASVINCYASLTLGTGGTYSYIYSLVMLASSGSPTITSNGKQWAGGLNIQSSVVVKLNDDLDITAARAINLGGGSAGGGFDANGHNVTFGRVIDDGVVAAFTVTMGTGTWTLSGAGSLGGFRIANANTTLNAGTSLLKFTDTGTTSMDLTIAGNTLYNVWFSRGASTGDITIAQYAAGNATFHDFKDDGTGTHQIIWYHGNTYTFTTFTVSGTSGHLITFTSDTTATYTFSCASGTISCDYLAIAHCVAGGGASWYAGANSTNNQAVSTAGSGWIFTALPLPASDIISLLSAL